MKRLSLSALVLLLSCTAAFSQRIMKVEKTDGTIVDYPVKDVKRVFFEGEELANLVISTNSVFLKVGETSTVEITSDSGHYTIVSDNPSIATAELNVTTIIIQAVAVGTATITVTDTQSGKTATIEVTVIADDPKIDAVAVDLGLPSGTLWADRNVGANSPEDYGGYYACGETEEKEVYDWSTYTHCDGSPETCHDIGSNIAGTQYDVAHVKWGGSWKMPTRDQMKELVKKCTSEWTTVNGVNGRKFTGPNGNSIFLPASGLRWAGEIYYVGTWGRYWSSTFYEDDPDSYGLDVDSSEADGEGYPRSGGCSVRPVR